MSGVSRKSEFVNSMARRALINSIGPIASTESYPEEDEFDAALENKDEDQENDDDDVFSSESPEPSEDQHQSPRQSQISLEISPEESPQESPQQSPQESPKTPIKQQSIVTFKDAGNLLRSSLRKRISLNATPLTGKRQFSLFVIMKNLRTENSCKISDRLHS